jgi:hypothetical protein
MTTYMPASTVKDIAEDQLVAYFERQARSIGMPPSIEQRMRRNYNLNLANRRRQWLMATDGARLET